MKIALKISYDGTDYAGWQVQKNAPTVQEKLNEAVFALTGERVSVTGSGRTDAGVHAAGQVAHFETESALPPEKYAPALNVFLPPDIRVLSSRPCRIPFTPCGARSARLTSTPFTGRRRNFL